MLIHFLSTKGKGVYGKVIDRHNIKGCFNINLSIETHKKIKCDDGTTVTDSVSTGGRIVQVAVRRMCRERERRGSSEIRIGPFQDDGIVVLATKLVTEIIMVDSNSTAAY